jgi:hypothetical protein
MPLDKQKVNEQLEQLQLEEAIERSERSRADKADREARRMLVQNTILENRRQDAVRQSACAHRKGGKGVGGAYSGNDQNFAVVKHTLSASGTTLVICMRCGKTWEPPSRKLIAKGASTKEREQYRTELTAYQWALNLPTDNEPSGAQILRQVEYYPTESAEQLA